MILARGGDAWLHLWDLWWADKSLVSLNQTPYQTTFLYYPTGLNLYYHSLDIFNGVISIPLQHLFGLTPAFNLIMLANLTVDGLAAYWLCNERIGSIGAALVGGAIFASTPLLSASIDLGQLDEVTAWCVPLYVLALWRALDSHGPVWTRGGGRRAAFAAGLSLAGASLATWYFTAGLIVFTIIFVPAYLLAKRDKARADWWQAGIKVALALVVFATLLSPLLWAMIGERLSGATYMLSSLAATLSNSADLAAFFLPARIDSGFNQPGSSVALGYIALVLSAIGLVKRRSFWPLALAFGVLLVMALGPQLQVSGNQTQIPLPYALLNDVPFIGASRQPLRFVATAGICMALLSAAGVYWLQHVSSGFRWKSAIVPVALALLVAELFGVPRLLASTSTEAAYTFLKNDQTPGAVIELPYAEWSAASLLHQTAHGRPIVGGYTSRHFPYPFADGAPGIAQLVNSDPAPLIAPDIVQPQVADMALMSLDYYNISFIVVHKASMATGRYKRLQTTLNALFSAQDKAYEDSEVVIYKSPPALAQARGVGKVTALVGLGSGWYSAEPNPLHRWTGNDDMQGNADVWIGIPAEAQGRYSFTSTLYSYGVPRQLSVLLDGKMVASKEIGTVLADLSVDLGVLSPGNHKIEIRSDMPPQAPPGDNRRIALGFTRIELRRN
ncbi:MAG: hypothetical protein IVW55_02200 [Chloroflexi bacterium]|nr:hypothetical protein [Chloroflexota bacterium]